MKNRLTGMDLIPNEAAKDVLMAIYFVSSIRVGAIAFREGANVVGMLGDLSQTAKNFMEDPLGKVLNLEGNEASRVGKALWNLSPLSAASDFATGDVKEGLLKMSPAAWSAAQILRRF